MWKTLFQNPYVRAVGVILAVLSGASLLYMLSRVLIPVFCAFIATYMFHPAIDYLERRRIPRMAAAVVVVVALILGLLVFPVVVVPGMMIEAQELMNNTARTFDEQWLNRFLDRLPLETLVKQLGWQPDGAGNFGARAIFAQRIGEFIEENIGQFLQANAQELATGAAQAGPSAQQFFTSVGGGLLAAVLFIGNFVLFAFMTVYLLDDYHKIVETVNDLIPPREHDRAHDLMRRIDVQLRGYLRGQVIVCVCLAVMYAVGLKLSGVSFAIPLAFFGGLASFVPYLGAILLSGPAILLAILEYGFDWHAVGVIATLVIAQSLEGYIIAPKIVGSHVGLGPVWVILAIMVFGSTLGLVGLLLAVPIAAVLKVFVSEAVIYYKGSFFFEKEASPAPARPGGSKSARESSGA